MFKPNSNQSTEGQAKKGTLSDLKEQQWQKPVASKNQDWVSGYGGNLAFCRLQSDLSSLHLALFYSSSATLVM
jgi:hypothetical protein